MPTVFTHALAGAAIAQAVAPLPLRTWLTVASGICAMVPDADVLAFRFGIPYGDLWGHRGMTHSFVFAAILGGAVAMFLWNRIGWRGLMVPFLCLFLATASHPLLDALTNGGLGVALLAPFDDTRFFFPVRPIRVSPIGIGAFLTARGAAVMASELVWVWIPSLLLLAAARHVRAPNNP